MPTFAAPEPAPASSFFQDFAASSASGAPLADAFELMQTYHISGFPVTEDNGKLVGILTNRDVRFASNKQQPVSELMTSERLITVPKEAPVLEVIRLMAENHIGSVLVMQGDEPIAFDGWTYEPSISLGALIFLMASHAAGARWPSRTSASTSRRRAR